MVSVIIPARNSQSRIGEIVHAVLTGAPAGMRLEVIVVDDGSTDDTIRRAENAGARVLRPERESSQGNPAAARNRGAVLARGDTLVFLDADCVPRSRWLELLTAPLGRGIEAAGGSMACPAGLSLIARCDYDSGWYHTHPRRKAGFVKQHPPSNLAVRAHVFEACGGFDERHPIAYSHEELTWQAELQRHGGRIYFEPSAVVDHYNRPGFANLLRRNYRWGYGAIESKSRAGITRFSWLYRHPWLPVVLSPFLAPASAIYIVGCWIRAGIFRPLWLSPVLLAARLAYSAGTMVGGYRWLQNGDALPAEHRPQWE